MKATTADLKTPGSAAPTHATILLPLPKALLLRISTGRLAFPNYITAAGNSTSRQDVGQEARTIKPGLHQYPTSANLSATDLLPTRTTALYDPLLQLVDRATRPVLGQTTTDPGIQRSSVGPSRATSTSQPRSSRRRVLTP